MKKTTIVEPSEILIDEVKVESKIAVINPWARFLARMVDYALLRVTLFFLPIQLTSIGWIPLEFLLWIPIEATFLTFLGYTPGKFFFKTKIVQENKKVDFSTNFKRSVLVWFRGIGLGIPIITIFTMIAGNYQLRLRKSTSWDRDLHMKVIHGPFHSARYLIAVIFLFFTSYINYL